MQEASAASHAFLQGGGDMGARMREFDWASHPLGDPEGWPQSLKSAVSICLGSRFPILLWWGPDLFMLYNDAYRPMLGRTKHPAALGQAGRACWPEIWPTIGPMLEDTVLRRGDATWSSDQLLRLDRNGFVEECYFTFTYSPIRDESGGVGGVFCAVIETTDRVVGERRLRLLTDLASGMAEASDERDVCARAMSVVAASAGDVPFAAIYLFEGHSGRLAARTPTAPGTLPERVDRGDDLAAIANGPSVAVPLAASGEPGASGVFLAGLNPQRPFDSDYQSFLGLVAGQIGSALADVRALESERRRAEALAQLDRAKTAFFSNVSHEFRTPLTLMLGPVQDALASPGRSMDERALTRVNRNAKRLLKLVNSLLDFARLEAGRVDAVYEPTDIAVFTTELAAAFRSAVESAGLRLVVECTPLEQPAYVDRSMWEKIVFNLLSNALKFTFDGEIAVRLEPAGAEVRLSIHDTGIGIDPTELPRVFDRFHRVRAVRARTHEGTGIGLALVHELVRLHGGTIDVDSTPGQGTTFTVLMPVGSGHLPAGAIGAPRSLEATGISADPYLSEALGWTAAAPEAAEPAAAGSGHRARILLADDNADMRDYVARLLADRWHVEAVGNGAAALAAARQHAPDLIVADVMMPEMDGFEMLAALRADAATKDIPVVLVSARAGEESSLGAIAAGADDYVVKPFTARDLIARVEAQLNRASSREAIRARMAQIESLIANAPLGVYLVDQDLRIAHANPIAREAFGHLTDIEGRDFDDAIHRLWTREYADEIVALFRRTLETGEPCVMPERAELRIDRGVVEYYEWRIVRIVLPDGRFGVVCYFVDVSSQVRARRAIAESEQRFRAFVTATSDVVYSMSADWTEMRLLDGRDLVGDTTHPTEGWIDKYVHPDDQPAVVAAIQQAIRAKATFELEHRVIRADGSIGWTFSRAAPLLDSHGDIVEWFGAARDISARKEAEEVLARLRADSEQQRRLYETILSSTPDLVYVFDLNHRFAYANEALLRMWGKTWDEAIGRNCLELGYEPWHAEMHDREIEEVIATGRPIRGEVPFAGTGGRRIYDYIFVPVFGTDGRVEAVAGATRDITERKQAEDTLRISEQQLAEANRTKDEFLATLSHELRTPLNAVLGWAHMLRTGTLRPELRDRALESLERNAQAQAQLVDDLLDVSRIISGKLPIRVERVDVNAVVAAAVDTVRPAAFARGLQLRTSVDAEAPVIVSGDPDRLRQAVWNLLSNAVKFTPAGGAVDVDVRALGTEAHIIVRDTGEGIDPSFLPFVFERFRQADSAPSRRHGGLGLGLAIVRHLTESHGGTVAADSAGPGRGATFTIRLPLQPARREPRPAAGPPPTRARTLSGIRVLVVDDQDDARDLTCVVLESRGAIVSAARSAGEALHTMRTQQFDVLVADIGMPGQDGYSLIRAIRGLSRPAAAIPAIALTAYASLSERAEALAVGYNEHLGKPVDPERIVAAVAAAVSSSTGR